MEENVVPIIATFQRDRQAKEKISQRHKAWVMTHKQMNTEDSRAMVCPAIGSQWHADWLTVVQK